MLGLETATLSNTPSPSLGNAMSIGQVPGSEPTGVKHAAVVAGCRVVGCGNLYAGDDAAGPLVIQRLAALKLPANVECRDVGTSGIDAALAFQGAENVIIIDACRSGRTPGSIVELGQEELAAWAESAPPNFHTLRWDQAVAVGRRLWNAMPRRLTIFLIEGETFELGAPLTPAVSRAVAELADGIAARLARPGLPRLAAESHADCPGGV